MNDTDYVLSKLKEYAYNHRLTPYEFNILVEGANVGISCFKDIIQGETEQFKEDINGEDSEQGTEEATDQEPAE